ncbi:MAG: hypothetical protein K0U45_06850 [Alphaproteobacteria bacterium]|nr:hypothetical protein [Alphaproteobacteria bacterium]
MRFLQKNLFIFTNSLILFISYVILANILPIFTHHDALADIQRNPDDLCAKHSITSPQKSSHPPIIIPDNTQPLLCLTTKKFN